MRLPRLIYMTMPRARLRKVIYVIIYVNTDFLLETHAIFLHVIVDLSAPRLNLSKRSPF